MSDADSDDASVIDERGDVLEAVFWGGIFLFTLVLFLYEFGVGFLDPAHGQGGSLPMGIIGNFKQALLLASILGGGSVAGLVVYAIFRYSTGMRASAERMRPGQGSFKLILFVIAVTAVMSVTIFQGAAVLSETDEATPEQVADRYDLDRQLDMEVQASQWFWRFDVAGVDFTQGERVVLPADTLVVFDVTSADVVHSFAIKELGITKDAIPGESNQAWFHVDEVEGETEYTYTTPDGHEESVAADAYAVRCAELCGKAHSKMTATIYVVSPEDYDHWAEDVGVEPAFHHFGEDDDGGMDMDDGMDMGGNETDGNATDGGDGHDDGGDH